MLERKRELLELRARDPQPHPEDVARRRFAAVLTTGDTIDARFLSSANDLVVAASGLAKRAPVIAALVGNADICRFLAYLWKDGHSVLVQHLADSGCKVFSADESAIPRPVPVPAQLAGTLADIFVSATSWAGALDGAGRHVFDPRSPAPGPHFFTNLLLGQRINLARPLQTTPKSVVDQLGRGSFRAHAATQVLATRWDVRPEENGFPANRQCYLVEDGGQIFYSADPWDANVAWAQTVHAPNCTTITCRTRCDLEITRTIFLLPGDEELPLATEVHSIVIANHGVRERRLRLVLTGMFGPAAPNALWEDVVYTNVSVQARLFRDGQGRVVALSPHYHPEWTKGDERFHMAIIHQGGQAIFPVEFCTSYADFVGRGTLERPEGLHVLSNRLARKGPAFFALAAQLCVPPSESVRADNFTCLVATLPESAQREAARATSTTPPHNAPATAEELMRVQIPRLVARFSGEDATAGALATNIDFFHHFRDHLQVSSGDAALDATVNHNLPFQVLYQTFVSRSFDQTQKGYREIGFREVQDLFAALPFFVGMGKQRFAAALIEEWAGQVHRFGYANHNFYWTGKEPGDFSDDPLWLVQAVDAYVNLTGDDAFLDRRCPVAGSSGDRRSIYDTIRAILRYCGEISIGRHGLPLLDRADWNDTLRLDPDYLNGPQKEDAYRRQLAEGGRDGGRLKTDNCESVMNAFLLKIALDTTERFARRRADGRYAARLAAASAALADRIQQTAWKGDFFARVLINRPGRYSYLGAGGDGLSADAKLNGCYFLNSLTWAVLADVATEQQIQTMLGVVNRALRTPHGLKLCSPVKFCEITSRGGSAEYFPGDRENGGVFKHANMMAAVALLKAAKSVSSAKLAIELRDLAYTVIDLVLPHRVMRDPYVLAGNPRFCTQYNNCETGENIGPTLSGTAPWLWLALRAAWGIEMRRDGIALDPMLRDDQRHLELELNTGGARYRVTIDKPAGFRRSSDDGMVVSLDGAPMPGNVIPYLNDRARHRVMVRFGGSA